MLRVSLAACLLVSLAASHASAQSAADKPWPWAHEPGTGESGPLSNKASNIDARDSSSVIAPHFEGPAIGENAAPGAYLQVAEADLDRHDTGDAQQALEMAETRLLDRVTPASAADVPDQSPVVGDISNALQALGRGDVAAARGFVRAALGK